MKSSVSARKIEYQKTSGPLGMDGQDVVDEYAKIMMRGFRNRYRKIAREALSLKPDAERIADIGTGPGFLTVELSKRSGKQVLAVDISPNMLEKARKLAKESGFQIKTIVADCTQLPFEDYSLDLVTSTNLIHMLDDASPFFAELRRIVKPGGKGLITGFRRDVPRFFKRIVSLSNVVRRNSALDDFNTVINASFTENELEQLLRELGFRDFTVTAGIITLKTTISF